MKKQFLLGLLTMALPLSMWAADTKISVSFQNKVEYAGKNTEGQVGITLTVGDKTLVPGSNYDLTVSKFNDGDASGRKIHDAGKYEVKITLNGSYGTGYVLDGVTNNIIKFEVEQKALTPTEVSLKTVTKEYGYSVDVKDLVDVKEGALADNDDAEVELADLFRCLEVVRPGVDAGQPIKDVDKYTINLRAATNGTSNYKYEEPAPLEQGLLTITPKKLTATLSDDYSGTAVTNLSTKTKTDCAEYANSKYTGVLDDDQTNFDITFTIPTGTTIKDYKSEGYTITATPTLSGTETKNYEVTATYQIKKVLLTITPATGKNLGVSFPTAVPTELNDYFDFEGLKGDDAKAKTGSTATTNSAFAKENLNLTMKIEGEMTYGDSKDVYPFVGTTKVTTTKQTTGSYNGKCINETALTNYVIEYEVKKFSAWKKQLEGENFEYTWNDEADLTYQGQDFEVPADIVTIVFKKNGKEYPLTYNVDYTLEAVNAAGSVRDAGDRFRVKVVAKETSTQVQGEYETPVGGKFFEVVKAPLKITRTDKELVRVKDGEKFNPYDGYFDFDGFVGEDLEKEVDELLYIYSLDPLTGAEVTSADGSGYQIRIFANRLQAKNYAINKHAINGTGDTAYIILDFLKILNSELLLDGAVEDDQIVKDLAVYDGLTVPTVTVKNLKSIRDKGILAEKWYNLVLPFEVSVRELSKAFGYAIVNVPNTKNTDPTVISYVLTMGNIPANTLMAFKVDEDMDWEEIIGDNESEGEIVFENKKIVAPTTWVTDGFHEYVGVYETEHIKGAEYSFLWTDGGFWTASNGRDTDIYPHGGYFKSVEGPAPTRIVFENPDGSTTAVSLVKTDAVNAAEGWYTVGGVKLNAQPTEKGVYINNGKKVVIK